MPTSFGILAFRKLPEIRNEGCLVRPLTMPDCQCCLKKLEEKTPFLQPDVKRTLQQGELQILCILRKDTHALVDLLRGRYGSVKEANDPHIRNEEREKMMSVWMGETTCLERTWLKTMPFHQIWNRMFRRRPSLHQEQMHSQLVLRNQCTSISSMNQDGQEQEVSLGTQLMQQSDSMNHHPHAEFGIPKGRLERKDKTTLDCAIREFVEETGFRAQDLTFHTYRTFEEEFIGTNGVSYKHIYWIAEISPHLRIPHMTTNQLGEIQNVGWFTKQEILSVLRSYDTAKASVISEAFDFMLSCDSPLSKLVQSVVSSSSIQQSAAYSSNT